jgi:hypothetical protein
MSQRGKAGTSQRWLDFCLSQPEGASETLLRGALASYSPFLTEATRAVRLSEMRTLTHTRVRASIATALAWAGRRAKPGSARYAHAVLSAARAIREGRTLP